MNGFAPYDPDSTRRPTESAISVRPAVAADLAVCAELIVTRTGGSAEDRRERLLTDLEQADRYVAVACAESEVIGYGGVFHYELTPEYPTAPTGYYLVGLIVAPTWRRYGIGELLTLDRMRWTAERADEIHYFANLANNATLDLHQRLGFTEVTRNFTFPNSPLKPGTGVLLKAPLSR
ncbi:GNAT family N-acetyltransferase [Streptomyces sp. SID13031]|uniref:GNAT family N-acetyltransferase n=1 Tax=Streptomyces sp. SID13031 TaxID=2706046 RepID=UPI0013CB8AA6|nr:GNAT family N-acetyltransferase [Streptomyces sp. SID13031]NEA30832.1 GNAT family N-acetyltransferase [Streptomyces sp. SID13031]